MQLVKHSTVHTAKLQSKGGPRSILLISNVGYLILKFEFESHLVAQQAHPHSTFAFGLQPGHSRAAKATLLSDPTSGTEDVHKMSAYPG